MSSGGSRPRGVDGGTQPRAAAAAAPRPGAAIGKDAAGHRPQPTLALYVPHLRVGGGELSLLRLARGFAAGGLRVLLIVNTLAGAEVGVPAGVEAVELGSAGTLGSFVALVRLLRRRRPKLLLSAFPHTNVAAVAAAACSRSGCRAVVTEHAPLSLQIARDGGWRYRLLPPLVRWAYRRAAAVVAVSAGVQADLLQLVGAGMRLSTIANPVLDDGDGGDDAGGASAAADPTGAVATPLHRWLLDGSLQVVLGVSRLSAEKDIPTLVHAFALLHARNPRTRLLLAGDGPEHAALQALVLRLGLGGVAELPGRINAPRRWMARAGVFALASRFEGFGNVLVEALASGTPVVATDCPVGPREILDGGRHGALVAVGDAAAFADALEAALLSGGAPAAARRHALQFTDAAACKAYRRLFDGLCDGSFDGADAGAARC